MSKQLMQKSTALKPTIQIGKAGITKEQIEHIKKQLDKAGLVKIKMLKSCADRLSRHDTVLQIAKATDAEIVYLTGFVFVLCKKIKQG